REVGAVGEETANLAARRAAENLHMWAAAGVGPGDDVRVSVAINVASCHVNAPVETGVVGEKVMDQLTACAAENAHMGSAADARGRDDIVHAITVDVTGSHADTAAEFGIKRVELPQQHAVRG